MRHPATASRTSGRLRRSTLRADPLGSDPHDHDLAVSTTAASNNEELVGITSEITSEAVIVTVSGEVGLTNAARLDRGISEALRDPAGRPVVVDLTRVSYLGTGGWSALVNAHNLAQQQDQQLRIVTGSRDGILRPLRMAGLDQVLPLCETMDEAQACWPPNTTTPAARSSQGPPR